MEKKGSVFYFDAFNHRMLPEDPETQTDQFRLRAVKFIHTLHPLASLIQRLYDKKRIDAQQRDFLFVWIGTFANLAFITKDDVTEQEMRFIAGNTNAIVAEEMEIWEKMSETEKHWWGAHNLPGFIARIKKDFPVDTKNVFILHPHQRVEIEKDLAELVDPRATTLITYLALAFRVMRLAHKRETPPSKNFPFFK